MRQILQRLAVAGSSCLLAAVLAIGSVSAGSVTEKFSTYAKGSTLRVDHSVWGKLLQAHVKPDQSGLNRVDYAAFKANSHAALKAYVSALQSVDVKTLDRPEQFAFWANLYNAKTLDVVLDHYPVKSIKKISIGGSLLGFLKKSVGAGGPWKAKIMVVSDQKLSLDDIEHGILRPVFKDPRVHYSVNCASIGCPNLSVHAFTGANLEAELDAGARAYVNHPRGVSVLGGSIKVSSIYSWFQSDFGGNAAGVLAHVRKYANPRLRAELQGISSISKFEYDWNLNDIPK